MSSREEREVSPAVESSFESEREQSDEEVEDNESSAEHISKKKPRTYSTKEIKRGRGREETIAKMKTSEKAIKDYTVGKYALVSVPKPVDSPICHSTGL